MLLMFYVRVREIHQPDWQNQHSYLGQSNSLPIISFLPLQHGWLMYFGLMGFHNQLYTFHTLVNLSVTIWFYIDTWHWMIEAAKHDKNGVLQSVPWSVGHLLSDVTSASRGSLNQPIRSSEAFPEHSFAGWKLRSFGVLEKSVWLSNKSSANVSDS